MLVECIVREDLLNGLIKDVLGDGGDATISNLELEDGFNILNEDGGFFILE